MNWYKQQSKIQKEAWDWQRFQKGFWAGAAIALASWLGLSQLEIQQLKSKLGDDQSVVQVLKDEVQKQGGNPKQIIQENTLEVSINENSEADSAQEPQVNQIQEQPQTSIEEKEGPDFVELCMDRLIEREGFRNKVYPDGAGVATVGIGHAMDDGNGGHVERSQRAFKYTFGDEVDWNDIRYGKDSLTDDEVRELAEYDIKDKANLARSMFNDFDNFPPYLQEALIDSVYRGDTGSNTTILINQGRWRAAAKEYLNRRDYSDAKAGRPHHRTGVVMSGIVPRMEKNRDAMLRYADELGQ